MDSMRRVFPWRRWLWQSRSQAARRAHQAPTPIPIPLAPADTTDTFSGTVEHPRQQLSSVLRRETRRGLHHTPEHGLRTDDRSRHRCEHPVDANRSNSAADRPRRYARGDDDRPAVLADRVQRPEHGRERRHGRHQGADFRQRARRQPVHLGVGSRPASWPDTITYQVTVAHPGSCFH